MWVSKVCKVWEIWKVWQAWKVWEVWEFQKVWEIPLPSLRIVASCQNVWKQGKRPSMNYVVSRGEGGQKLPILLSKKTTKRGGGGSEIADFEKT